MGYNTVTVGNTATLIIAANTQRQELTIVNASTSIDIFVGPDASITSANAIPLYAQQRNDRWKGPGGSWLGPVYGITASGSADVRYWEVVR